MRVSRGISAAASAAVLAGSFSAASALDISGPLDIPPASFSGRQYVDAAGCVFVRAGVGSSVSWVARVDRSGSHLCGYVPTFGATAVASAPPPAAAPAAPRPTTTAPMATIAMTATPPPPGLTPRPVTQLPAPAVAVAAAPVAAPPTPGRYVSPYVAQSGAVPPQLPTIVATAEVVNPQSVCPNLSPVAQRYMLSDGRNVVRCGPQTADPVGYINGAGVPGLQVASGMVPQPALRALPPVPPGYRAAWDDDRLNPYRGVPSGNGAAQMAQLWSDEVPARMLASAPAQRVAVSTPGAPQVTLSSKSAPAAVQPQRAATTAAPAGARFVQVGTYGVPANADASRARLRALGLQVASSRVVQGGRELQIVYAGPFDTSDALARALGLARGAGFSDAFAR
ncbi:MAG: SPOR domain-containing protein [Phaeovulum sp.]|uniref:SPOR domain-containing protein n=1 Tax=Phaeovulum sp. TaxID=2934796 RepID=UPI002730F2CE|nr:SPOR domain-containing protein [Phaeovulum sp.]MDP2062003.1 SPOR domain-containing protein [Phaeovulum sp.]